MFAIHKLRALIKERNITTVELSKELNVVYSTLARLIHGQTTNPRPETVCVLAKFFGVRVSDLYDNEGMTIKEVDGRKHLYFSNPSCVLSYLLVKNELLNTKALHQVTDIPKANLDRIMVGATATPNMRTLKQLAKYFNISISQLMAVEPIVLDAEEEDVNTEVAVPVLPDGTAINDFLALRRDISDCSTLKVTLPSAQAANVFVYQASALPGRRSYFKAHSKLLIDTKAHPKTGDLIMAKVADIANIYELHRLTEDYAILQTPGSSDVKKVENKSLSMIGVLVREVVA